MAWQTKKLGDICDILDAQRKPVTRRDRISGEYPYYGATGIQDYVGDYIFNEKLILIGEDGAKWGAGENTAFAADGKYWVNNHAHVIRPHRDIVLDNWIIYFLNVKDISGYITGLTVQKLNQAKLRNIELPIPPITEQRRLVKKLDEVFDIIIKAKNNTEKNLENSKAFFESYTQKIFTHSNEKWEKKRLSETFQIKPSKKDISQTIGANDLVSFVPMRDIEIGTKEFTPKTVRKLKDVQGSYIYFADEDVLLAKITPCFENGKLGIARNLKNKIGFGSSEYIVFRSRGEIIPDYLYYFLNREQFRRDGARKMSGAVGHKRVSMDFIENSILLYPRSLSEQKNIVDKLDMLSDMTKKLEKIYKQKITDLEEFKRSILWKAFTKDL